MNILKQAGLRHLIRHKNSKQQPPRILPPPNNVIKTIIEGTNVLSTQIINEIEETTERRNMPTLGETAMVSITPTSPLSQSNTYIPTQKEMILDFIKNHPDKCRNTRILSIADEVHKLHPAIAPVNSLRACLSSILNKGEILRIPEKGKVRIGTFVIPEIKKPTELTKVNETTNDASVKLAEAPTERPAAEQPVVDIKPTTDGVQISITLNINLNHAKEN